MSRLLGSIRAVVGLLAATMLLGFWTLLQPRNRTVERWIWRSVLTGFRITVRIHGDQSRRPGTLYVANHVSWADIAVLGELVDGAFVAKEEVAHWPLIGPGARRIGCLFISRHRRGEIGSQVRQLNDQLSDSNSLVLFAEGTTGLGNRVLPFRSSLLAVAEGRVVQPVSLCWRRRDGKPSLPEDHRRFAWIGDDDLLPHAMALARAGGAHVDVYFELPVLETDRKAATRACEAAIAARLAEVNVDLNLADQAATLNRAA